MILEKFITCFSGTTEILLHDFAQNKDITLYEGPELSEHEKNPSGFIFRCPFLFRRKPHGDYVRSEVIYAALGLIKREYPGVL